MVSERILQCRFQKFRTGTFDDEDEEDRGRPASDGSDLKSSVKSTICSRICRRKRVNCFRASKKCLEVQNAQQTYHANLMVVEEFIVSRCCRRFSSTRRSVFRSYCDI